MNSRLKTHATVGTVGGLLSKFMDEQEFTPKSLYWLTRTNRMAIDYLRHLPALRKGDYVQLERELEAFFGKVFERGKAKHIMTFIEFFIGILDDLQDRNDRMVRLIETTMKTRTALADQYAEWPACTVAGARIADKWGEMWTD